MNFFLLSLIKAAVVAFVLLTTLAYLQWVERKVIAHIQVRLGPSRVGPHGLMQPLADVIKLITKEDLIPPYVNKFLYLLAPFLAITMALLSISVIPFGSEIHFFGNDTWMQLTDLNIGILFVLAISSMGVYGIALAGWASNNKYSLLGGLRSSAQMISYELPLSMAVAAPLLLANTLSLRQIVERQSGFYLGFIPRWSVFQFPLPQVFSFIIFMIAAFAETNRVPFDLPEAENELVAGFHTEYSSMKFAAFFMAEYANMVTVCSIAATLFLGGWLPLWPAAAGSSYVPSVVFLGAAAICLYHGLNPARRRDRLTLPFVALVFFLVALIFLVPVVQAILAPVFWFAAKTGSLLFLYIWIRGTLPRFRYDQLMAFAWKFLFPAAVLNLLVTGFLVALFPLTMDVILFLIFAVIAVVCGINVVVQSHPISSAVSLIGVMGSLAVLYLLLGAEFLAAAQVIVYAGAIMVLFVFVIMLLNAGAETRRGRSLPAQLLGVPLLIAFLGLLAYFVQRVFPGAANVQFGAFQGGTAQAVGRALFTQFLLPFEVISVLILIAILGAVVLARKELE